MTPQDLIQRARAEGVKLKVRDGTRLVADPINRLSPELRELLKAHKPEVIAALADPAAESRRQRVLELLANNRSAQYAALTDAEAMPGCMLVTLAIRDVGTVELVIPAEKWDWVLFLDLPERHGRTMH